METEKPIVIASISGGKDSIAMGLMLLERGEHVDYFVFADTGMEFPETYDAIKRFEKTSGKKIVRVCGEKSFMFEAARIEKRKKQEGYRYFGYGWPSFLHRWCNSDLKVLPIRRWIKSLGYSVKDVVQLVGIAADEPKRIREKPGFRYPLAEWGITEAQCLEYCRARGFFPSPCAYDHVGRMSCFCCPLSSTASVRYLWKYRPDMWERIKQMEREIGEPWKQGTDVYEQQFTAEEQQGNLFTTNNGEKE